MNPHPGRRSPFPGSVTIEREPGGRRVLCLTGDVDSAVVAEFEARQGRLPVVVDAVDAGGVSFLGSAGLAVMIRYAEAIATAGRAPVLRAASDHVERLLRATGMEPYFVRPEMTSPPGQNETGSSSTP